MSAFEVIVEVYEGDKKGEHLFKGSDENIAIRRAKKLTKDLEFHTYKTWIEDGGLSKEIDI